MAVILNERGTAMREARKRAGLTLRDLESLSGVSFGTIAAIERGDRAGYIDTIELLADALGLSLDDYVGREVPQ